MKNVILIFCFFLASCASHQDIPILAGKDMLTINNLQNEAPFEKDNVVEGRAFSNLPKTLWRFNRSNDEWDTVIDKYGADVEYGIDEINNKTYIIRWLKKWPEAAYPIKKPEDLFLYLKAKGFSNYEILAQNEWQYDTPQKHYGVLILYQNVKNNIIIRPDVISVTSYLLNDKEYWESQGQFMLDTPVEILEKYQYKNQ